MDQLYYYEKLFIIHLGGIRISLLDGTQAVKPAVFKRLELKGREYIIYVADGWTQHSQRMEDVCIHQKDWNNARNRSISCLLSPCQFLSRNKNRKPPSTGNLFSLCQPLPIYPHLPLKMWSFLNSRKRYSHYLFSELLLFQIVYYKPWFHWFLFVWVFRDKVSVCSAGWFQIHNLPALISLVNITGMCHHAWHTLILNHDTNSAAGVCDSVLTA